MRTFFDAAECYDGRESARRSERERQSKRGRARGRGGDVRIVGANVEEVEARVKDC